MSFISQTGMGTGRNGNVASHSRTSLIGTTVHVSNCAGFFSELWQLAKTAYWIQLVSGVTATLDCRYIIDKVK